ncbi:DUF1217 domain-containing protein [Celeribacter marinus]|uniref:DUF1217 domain-containing protein n=1 Tax=Celeribacter marinus TaxID=1397108 RepID=UPI003F6D19A6
MSFQPVVPFGGYSGWAFLNRTKDAQMETFRGSADIQRDVDYFKENIGKVKTAEDLVSDRTLRKVVLGAFDLDGDIDNIYFIQKVLSDGILDDGALANKLSDTRYYDMAKAFGFDLSVPNTVMSTFPDEIAAKFEEQQFEIAVGDQDSNMRLAMSLDRELSKIADKSTTDNGRWYSVMGNTAVRSALETALGLPSSLGSLDLDQQLSEFREKTERYFGSTEVSQFSDPDARQEMLRLFLVRADIQSSRTQYSSAANALTLLSGSY